MSKKKQDEPIKTHTQMALDIQEFDRLTVLAKGAKRFTVIVVCQCGTFKQIPASRLISRVTRSCGCLHHEMVKNLNKDSKKSHGLSNHPLYNTWRGILHRCYNPKCKNYKDYGGRGIDVCDRWRNSMALFLEDMGEKPGKGYSLDRVDNDKGYHPENCRWATRRTQNLNTRRTTVKGAPWTTYSKESNKWYGTVVVGGERKSFHLVNSPEEASRMVYDYLTNVCGEAVVIDSSLLEAIGV